VLRAHVNIESTQCLLQAGLPLMLQEKGKLVVLIIIVYRMQSITVMHNNRSDVIPGRRLKRFTKNQSLGTMNLPCHNCVGVFHTRPKMLTYKYNDLFVSPCSSAGCTVVAYCMHMLIRWRQGIGRPILGSHRTHLDLPGSPIAPKQAKNVWAASAEPRTRLRMAHDNILLMKAKSLP
jgi:hypothetical protein